MRRLLVLFAVIWVGVLLSPADTGHSQIGYPYDAYFFLYHPTGDTSGNGISKLSCGWHDNCNPSFPGTAKVGLDWQWSNGSTIVWVRNTIILNGGPSSGTWVARMQSTNITGNCPARVSDLLRTIDWAPIGTVRNNHSTSGYASQYSNLYGKSGSGQSNAEVVGGMVNPDVDDCSNYWHTMQYYVSGLVDGSYAKNTSLPDISWCYHCNWTYLPWSPWEYTMQYWAY